MSYPIHHDTSYGQSVFDTFVGFARKEPEKGVRILEDLSKWGAMLTPYHEEFQQLSVTLDLFEDAFSIYYLFERYLVKYAKGFFNMVGHILSGRDFFTIEFPEVHPEVHGEDAWGLARRVSVLVSNTLGLAVESFSVLNRFFGRQPIPLLSAFTCGFYIYSCINRVLFEWHKADKAAHEANRASLALIADRHSQKDFETMSPLSPSLGSSLGLEWRFVKALVEEEIGKMRVVKDIMTIAICSLSIVGIVLGSPGSLLLSLSISSFRLAVCVKIFLCEESFAAECVRMKQLL